MQTTEESPPIDQKSTISQALRSTPSKDGGPTDVALLMHASEVGSLVDFQCTHRRIRGRLYATEDAILFYSNLLGFETRISIFLADIRAMQLCRSTSIELHLCDGEVYTFRSFPDRERALDVIKTLKEADDARRSRNYSYSTPRKTRENRQPHLLRSQASDPTALVSMRLALSSSTSTPVLKSYSTVCEDDSSIISIATPIHSNRQRAASDTAFWFADSTHDTPDRSTLEVSFQSNDDVSFETDTSLHSDQTNPVDADIEMSWRVALEMNHAIGTQNVGINNLQLSCDLDSFFERFLADDAPYSVDKFQRETMGDSELQITAWTNEDPSKEMPILSRTMTFVHPIKNSMGMGPSEAQTTRIQRLCRYGSFGLTLENTTHVIGIPAADAFFIRDHWLVESVQGGEHVRLATRFGTHFHKRSLLKSFIEKSILTQTTEWFSGYSTMLTRTLEGEVSDVAATSQAEQTDEPTLKLAERDSTQQQVRRLTVVVACLSITIIVVVLQLVVLQRSIGRLHAEVLSLRHELVVTSQVVPPSP